MTDRVPSEVLENGAIRYELFDSEGVSQGYQWIKRADEPIEAGTPLTKANLLSDATETAIWGGTDDRTINATFGALRVLSGTSAPTTSTEGVVGQLFLNTVMPALYQCLSISGSVYTWKKVGPQFVAGSFTSTYTVQVISLAFTRDLVITYGFGNNTYDIDNYAQTAQYHNVPRIITSAWTANGDGDIVSNGFEHKSHSTVTTYYIAIKF